MLEEPAGVVDDVVPLEGVAGVGLVVLDVVVAQDALVGCEVGVGEFVSDEGAVGVAGVVAAEVGEDFAKGRGEADECVVLLSREVVLAALLALHFADDEAWSDGAADESWSADAAIALPAWDGDACAEIVVGVPLCEGVFFVFGVGAHVGDFDADGAVVGGGGVPGAFFEVEGLVDGAVEVDHEVDGESSEIVEDFEALSAGATDVVMEDELIDGALEEREVPAAASDAFELVGGEVGAAEVVAVWGFEA